MGLTLAQIRPRLYADTTNEPHDELLDLALPLREFNALARSGVQHVDDLEVVLARADHVPGIGARGWQHIHDALREFRDRRGETPPPPRPPTQRSAPSIPPKRTMGPFQWTVLEEQRLLDELAPVPSSELRFAIARAAERRGVTAASISGKFNGLSTSARSTKKTSWTQVWLRRLHDEIAQAGDERGAALDAWAKRRRCDVAEIERLLAEPTAIRRQDHRPARSTNPSPRSAAQARAAYRVPNDEFAHLSLHELASLDRRIRGELELRVAAMTTALTRNLPTQ